MFAVAGVTSYLAWSSLTSLTAPSDLAQSFSANRTAQPEDETAVQSDQAAQSAQSLASATNPGAAPRTQTETDYLLDLSQGLQTPERDRLNSTQQLQIAQDILGWLREGADYWGVREKFDADYRSQIAGDYAHNRDVYIRFATERFAPDHRATLKQPIEQPIEVGAAPEVPIETVEAAPFDPEDYAPAYPYPPVADPYVRSGQPFYPRTSHRVQRLYPRRAF